MSDALSTRGVFAVLAPSTNTIVEADFSAMRVPGVTPIFSRIHIRDQSLGNDEDMEALLDQIRLEEGYAIDRVCTAEPDYMVMGMSAETFWEGMEGNRRFCKRVSDRAGGLGVASGAEACEKALELFGVKKIAVLTPYQPIGDLNVERFFTELGFEVTKIIGLKCPTAVDIARVTEQELRDSLVELADTGCDAIVQCGTNLSMLSLADEAERWLGIPVIAINAATWWFALRQNGITDQVQGVGRLFREF
ncbi:MAG: arylmalonate decarboxylase [Myxococcota bacterium]|nr:arylmalonate decarboxylase [Myxococcota bacterium]